MAKTDKNYRKSAFNEHGFKGVIDNLIGEVKELYLADAIPWIVGYSGGKDSTATLQLVWCALEQIPDVKRTKPIYVITNDTLVENPIVVGWVTRSLARMKQIADKKHLPFTPLKLEPAIDDTFWVNLIGRGYPAPKPMFRWCTQRLKIDPVSDFVSNVIKKNGEAIIVLGTRKAESVMRARTIERHEQSSIREHLSPHADLHNAFVYSPIKEWSNDDVWLYLMQIQNPWGVTNKDLLTMYQGASADGECPLVMDTNTPSCGDSRFGCWVCTLVDKDKSMHAMIQNDNEKEWMLPLLELRNELDREDDKHLRDFRRMKGNVQIFKGNLVRGPYIQSARERWLKKVLEAQQWIRKNGPKEVRDIELVTMAELHEIRRIWVIDKHEIEDSLPKIYKEVTGKTFPGERIDDNLALGAEEMQLLQEICENDRIHYELVRELLDIEIRYRTMAKRAGLFESMEQAFQKSFYEDIEDAAGRERTKQVELEAIRRRVE